jgi:anthranilate phosphoribosyltransferase
VVGVYSREVIDLMAAALGTQRALVVHGADGLDEISLSGETFVAEVRDGQIKRFTVIPENFGVTRAPLESLRGGTAVENATAIRNVLENEAGPRRDVAVINASAALVVAGIAVDFREGARMASKAISSGIAKQKLAALVAFTNSPSSEQHTD